MHACEVALRQGGVDLLRRSVHTTAINLEIPAHAQRHAHPWRIPCPSRAAGFPPRTFALRASAAPSKHPNEVGGAEQWVVDQDALGVTRDAIDLAINHHS